MSQVTYVDGNRRSFTEKSDVNLDGKEFELVQLITDGETVKLRTDGAIALGVYEGKLINGQHEVTVRTLGSGGTYRVRQSAAIVPGARVMADSDNPTKVKTAAANGALPVRTLGIKLGTANGAAGDIIEVLDLQEDITALDAAAVFTVTHAALTDSSGGTANTTVEACGAAVTGVDGTGSNAASKADVDARLAAIANNFADVVAQLNAARTDIVALKVITDAAGLTKNA